MPNLSIFRSKPQTIINASTVSDPITGIAVAVNQLRQDNKIRLDFRLKLTGNHFIENQPLTLAQAEILIAVLQEAVKEAERINQEGQQ